MSNDIIGSITGVATYSEVEIVHNGDKERYEVTGHYMDSVTTYGSPLGELYIEHMKVGLDPSSEITLTAKNESFIYVEATEDDQLILTRENPQDKTND